VIKQIPRTILAILPILPLLFPGGLSLAASSFSDSFDNETLISQTARIAVDTPSSQITLQADAESLTDDETTLLVHFESDADITTPAIAGGAGGTPTGITYTTGGGGYDSVGEAAIISGAGKIAFPVSGNFNFKKGTIDFYMSLADWSLTSGRTTDYPNENTILYIAHSSNKYLWLIRDWNGTFKLRVWDNGQGSSWMVNSQSVSTSSFTADSWHHFTVSWNIEEDSFYMSIWKDGVYLDTSEMADAAPNNFDVGSFISPFSTTTFYIGNNSGGTKPLNGKIDELRITSTELALTDKPGKAGIVTSTAFDTGVASPAWGDISWSETLPAKTDIELQTSTSDDGVTWTSWFSQDEPVFTATFDDGYSGTYDNALSVMNGFGFDGVSYIVTNNITSPRTTNYMITSEIQALEDAGWEIGSHTSTHTTPSTSNLSAAQTWLTSNGFTSSAFAYVGGTFNQTYIDLVNDYHTTARTIINQYQTYNTKYRLYAYPGNASVSDVNSWVDAVVNKKAWGILTFHSIGQTGISGNVSTADFTSILQHISDSGFDVLNMSDALTRLAMYTDNTGDQILAANKRYIRYRALLHSYDGATTPTLSSVQISAPAKIYKDIATTVSSAGTYDHATWPQTTDTAINNLTVTPSSDSVVVTVDTWNTSGTYYKRWTESSTNPAITTTHSVGDLAASTVYNIAIDGAATTTATTNGSGVLTFNYSGGYSSAHTITVSETDAPTVSLDDPVASVIVSGDNVSLTASASDTSGVAGVQFKFDTNSNVDNEDTSSPYVATWNSTVVSDGSHTLSAVARDTAGNYATSTITVTVDNSPSNRAIFGVRSVPISSSSRSSSVFTPTQLAILKILLSRNPTSPTISSPIAKINFIKPLRLGQNNSDVKQLQFFLNTHDFPVAVDGPGSPGRETNYFGKFTQKALGQFQLQNGLVASPQDPAYGYLGPKTRALINGMR